MQNVTDYDGFAAHLALNDRRRTTIRKHLNCLHRLERCGIPLELQPFTNFLQTLKNEGKSNAYLNLFINAVRLYAQYKGLQDLLKIKGFNARSGIKATLSDEEIDTFLALPKRSHEPANHYRMFKMFWALVADTGARPGEIARLKVPDIDWGRGVIIIEISKTNQPGVVPIPPNHVDELKEYLAQLQGEFLFPSARGHSSYTDGFLPVVDNVDWHYDWKKRLGVMQLRRPHLTPYSFRHSYATRLLEEDISLFHVKKLMRHRDLKSTLVYEHLTTKDLIKAQGKLPRIQRHTDPIHVLQRWADKIKEFQVEQDDRFEYEYTEDGGSIHFHVAIKKSPTSTAK